MIYRTLKSKTLGQVSEWRFIFPPPSPMIPARVQPDGPAMPLLDAVEEVSPVWEDLGGPSDQGYLTSSQESWRPHCTRQFDPEES